MFEIELNDGLRQWLGLPPSQQQQETVPVSTVLAAAEIRQCQQSPPPLYPQLKGLLQFVPSSSRLDKLRRRCTYSPEFARQLEQLRVSQLNREYDRLVRSNKGLDDNAVTFSQIHKEIKEQLTTIVNIAVTVVSVVVAVWYWSPAYALHHRLLLCLFFAILVLVADVVVYLNFINAATTAA